MMPSFQYKEHYWCAGLVRVGIARHYDKREDGEMKDVIDERKGMNLLVSLDDTQEYSGPLDILLMSHKISVFVHM